MIIFAAFLERRKDREAILQKWSEQDSNLSAVGGQGAAGGGLEDIGGEGDEEDFETLMAKMKQEMFAEAAAAAAEAGGS